MPSYSSRADHVIISFIDDCIRTPLHKTTSFGSIGKPVMITAGFVLLQQLKSFLLPQVSVYVLHRTKLHPSVVFASL